MVAAEDGSWPPVMGSRKCQGPWAVLTVEKITDNSLGKKEKVALENQGYEAPSKKKKICEFFNNNKKILVSWKAFMAKIK